MTEKSCSCPHCSSELKNACFEPGFCKPCSAKRDDTIKICPVCKCEYLAEYEKCPSCSAESK